MVRVLICQCLHLGSLSINQRLKYAIKLADKRDATEEAEVLPAAMSTGVFPKQGF